MAAFSTELVNEICRKCNIPPSDWEWLNGKQRQSTGAAQRLRLLSEDARKDKKTLFDEDRVKCFLDTISREKWYPRWRSWVVENSKHRIREERLPPAGGA
jgi:hypothetical protein